LFTPLFIGEGNRLWERWSMGLPLARHPGRIRRMALQGTASRGGGGTKQPRSAADANAGRLAVWPRRGLSDAVRKRVLGVRPTNAQFAESRRPERRWVQTWKMELKSKSAERLYGGNRYSHNMDRAVAQVVTERDAQADVPRLQRGATSIPKTERRCSKWKA